MRGRSVDGPLSMMAAVVLFLPVTLSVGASAESEGANAIGDDPWRASVELARPVVALEGRSGEGRTRYRTCAECHLADGRGDPGGTMPQLAGQHRSVLIKQMLDIRSGRRHNPLMLPYVEQLPDLQAIADVATYVAGLPPSQQNGRGVGEDVLRGRRLYRIHCASCHGPAGEGNATAFIPALRGQHYRYVVRQLIDIAASRRVNAHPGMVAMVESFSARDIASVADFVSRMAEEGSASEAGGR